jgi:hypothetical protein
MNWDTSIGWCKQAQGQLLQLLGKRLAQRGMILSGEALEYAGRLQLRYGLLKHQVQWSHSLGLRREPIAVKKSFPV